MSKYVKNELEVVVHPNNLRNQRVRLQYLHWRRALGASWLGSKPGWRRVWSMQLDSIEYLEADLLITTCKWEFEYEWRFIDW